MFEAIGTAHEPMTMTICKFMFAAMTKQIPPDSLESRILRAFRLLQSTSGHEPLDSFVVIERVRNYEIRLADPPAPVATGPKPVWVELFDSTSGVSLDSFTSSDLRRIVAGVETFIVTAQQLHARSSDSSDSRN